ncbi:MAG: bifunctional riboflavin kinase/FAD synthetase [candidate division WOR-3 bacterium]
MRIIYDNVDNFTFESVCALGNFDGVHIAHQEIIRRVKQSGSSKKTGIITFHPPPVSVLHKNEVIFLTTKTEKEEIFKSLGIDFLYYFSFDEKFARKPPEEFVNLIYNMVRPSVVVVGENFHFGKERRGNAKVLREMAQGKYAVEIVPKIKDEGGIISSTRIRELLLLGNIPRANQLLGREYSITGDVVKGKGKGITLGFPTINLNVEKGKLLPLDGVYEVKLELHNKLHQGAMFLHHNDIEVHILDFSGNLYGEKITVKLIKRLRAIKKFSDDAALKRAIDQDIQKIKDSKT